MRAVVVALLLLADSAAATPLGTVERAVYAEVGLDGALAVSLGFAAGVAGERLGLVWHVDGTWALGGADLGDNRLRAGARVDALRHGRFQLRAALAASRRATDNAGFQAQALTTELELSPVLALGRFTVGLEASLEQVWLAYLEPTERYRELIHADARAAWYALPGRTLRLGAAAGVRLGAVEVAIRAGMARSGAMDFLPPFHASASVALRL